MKKLLIFIFLVGIFLLLSGDGFCWSIGTHLFIGTSLLERVKDIFPLSLYNLLYEYKDQFLYGTISADILIGKGRRLYPTHCHSWNVGFTILNCADSLPLKSYAYGYLVHLASDVIAHNFFIPNLLQLSKGKGKISHILIEASVDKEINYSSKILAKLVKDSFKDGDKLLQKVLYKSKINFYFKKSIYKLLNILSLKKNNKQKKSSIILKNGLKDYLFEMLNLSVSVSCDCLIRLTNSEVTKYDPMGFENLKLVKSVKRKSALNPIYKQIYLFFSPSTFILNTEVRNNGKGKDRGG